VAVNLAGGIAGALIAGVRGVSVSQLVGSQLVASGASAGLRVAGRTAETLAHLRLADVAIAAAQ
jgi:hypothetical protein